ncbi:polyprenol dehydrogenase-like [Tachypleus tridentatus]|uniref:polyprenol dehydrogenase-like n=1 Tax=Tachypleus tridentatus TaxID=6853 RepID=UPI003FD436DA
MNNLIFGLWNFILVYYIGFVYLFKEFFGRKLGYCRRLQKTDLPNCDGKVAIVTGGTRGIGLQVVRKLLSLRCRVIVASSTMPEKGSSFEKQLKSEYPGCQVEIWRLNLLSMVSVKEFADRFLETGDPLHLLINNAGVMFEPYKLTADGFESHFAINYLSHCFLTQLLLPRLHQTGENSKKTRIINVSSAVHFVATTRFDDLQSQKLYSSHHGYLQSKLAQVMFTFLYEKFLEARKYNVTINCLHPGVVNTGLYHNVWWTKHFSFLLNILKTPEEGAETILYAALSPEMEGVGGMYLEECVISKPSNTSQDKENQEKLWKVTWELLKPWCPQTPLS